MKGKGGVTYDKRGTRGDRVGAVAISATDMRGRLDREDGRWLALKRDVAGYTATDDTAADWPGFRQDFLRDFYSWRLFYRDNYDNLAGDLWPLSDTAAEINEWASVLDGHRARFTEVTGREASAAARRRGRGRSAGAPGAGTATLVLGGLFLGGLAYAWGKAS